MYRVLALALLLAGCGSAEPGSEPAPAASASPAPAPTPSASPTPEKVALTPEGWGPLRIGMTRAEAERALGPDAALDAHGGPDPERCDQFRPARAPEGMIVMTEGGRVTRLSLVGGATVGTDRGLRLGSTAAEVESAYGPALKTEPHEYVIGGRYLTYWATGEPGSPASETARGVRYEIGADGKVTSIHAGGPSITYSEGCA